MNTQMKNMPCEYRHKYIVKQYSLSSHKCVVYSDTKLPPLLKKLREYTGYRYKIPHGNKVRTLILEDGACVINVPDMDLIYEITIERW